MKRVLVVVDYQNDFVNGALGFESAKNLDSGIAKLMREYLADPDALVVVTFDTHTEDYLNTQEGRKLPVVHCVRGSEGWMLYGEVGKVYDNDVENKIVKVEKPTFGSVELADVLRNYEERTADRVESVTIVGIVTNMCTISNAVVSKAALPEAEIIVLKDLVDSFDKELHQKALDVMASMQMTVK